MNFRHGDESASPGWSLTSILTTVLLSLKVRLPLNLAATGMLALSLSLLALFAAGTPTHAYVSSENFEPDQVVVKIESTRGSTIEEISADYGLTVLDALPGSDTYLVKEPAGSGLEKVLGLLEDDPRLLFAEPNFVVEAAEGNGAEGDGVHKAFGISDIDGTSEQYAAAALGLPCAADISSGKGTTIAVLDTGVQLDHRVLRASFKGTDHYDFVDDDSDPSDLPVGLDVDGNGIEDEMVGHGTHVAGIVNLVAPAAKIMPLRVLNTEGRGNVFGIAKGISYARSNGADVINLSLGTSSPSRLLREAVMDATRSGVVVVAAAGNSNTTVPHYPAAGNGISASVDGLLATTSVDMYEKKSGFANYGLWVDVAAPGTGIRSTFPVDAYATWSGTSMATPFISGQAALIRAVDGSLGSSAVEKKIRLSARPLDLKNLKYAGMLGAGQANVCASLR